MSPKGKLFHPDYAKELLDIAEGDLGSAKALAKVQEGRPENICYMAQQCVEKCLKAALCHLGKTVILSHDLDALLSHLPEDKRPPNQHQLGVLTEYSLIRRYEKGYEILTQEDIKFALELAEVTWDWARKLASTRVQPQ